MRKLVKLAAGILVLAAIVGTAGCGDSGGDAIAASATTPGAGAGPAPGNSVPDSAVASAGAMVGFLQSMGADETSEPLQVNVVLPLDDSGEPLPLS